MSSVPPWSRRWLRTLAACALGGVAIGCVGSGVGVPWTEADPSATPATYAEIQTMVFDAMCVQCHSGGSAPKGLVLDAQQSHRHLVDVPSVEVPEMMVYWS